MKSTFDTPAKTMHYAELSKLVDKARSAVRESDPSDDLKFLRIRSNKEEIMMTADKDFTTIVVQKLTDETRQHDTQNS